ncbi:MAG: tetratricopeptide repeat protein [Candidatus Lokiarchaeota archaeon]|nr:tetratricopeptide repeat protein [Candidatus Lokiarchaeota archaeon]
MKLCPYCDKPIENQWRFCHHCNKPLISDLDRRPLNSRTNSSEFEDYDSYNRYNYESEESFDVNILEDQNIDEKINQIDQKINQSSYGDNIGDLYLEKAGLYYKKRDLSNSLKELELALESFEHENVQEKIAIAHNEIGLLKEELGYFDNSIYHFDTAINIFKNMEDTIKLIQVYNNIGNAYYQLKDIENSYGFYQKAIELAEEDNMRYEEVKSSSNIVEVLFVLQDFERIKKILKKNYNYFSQNNDIFGLINTYSKYGKLYFYLGENYYEKAYEYLNNAMELAKQIESQISIYAQARMQWEIFLFMGKIDILRNRLQKAENFLLKSLESIRTFEIEADNIKESIILEDLGNLYEIRDEFEKAIEYYTLASEIYYKFGEDFKTAELKTKIAQIYHNSLRKNIEAIDFYENALEIFEKLEYFKEMAQIFDSLGNLYLERDLTEVAINNFEQAKYYYKEIKDNYHTELVDEKINSLIK